MDIHVRVYHETELTVLKSSDQWIHGNVRRVHYKINTSTTGRIFMLQSLIYVHIREHRVS